VVAGVSPAGFWNAADTAAAREKAPAAPFRHYSLLEESRRKLLQSVKNMLCFSPLWLF
jgi:hypothetical protein